MIRNVNSNFELDEQNAEKHMGIICRVCFKSNFKMTRYKCLVCEDFDICSHCFESPINQSVQDHDIKHLMIKLSEPNKIEEFSLEPNTRITIDLIKELFKNKVHEDSTCSCCNSLIEQIRIKCDSCLEYEFCYECYRIQRLPKKVHSKNHSYNYHPMLIESKHSLEIDVNKIELLGELDHGLTSKNYIAKVKGSKKIYVCKIITFDEVESEFKYSKRRDIFLDYLNELKHQNELKSVNKINLYAYAIDMNYDSIYLLTEYMTKKDLNNFLTSEKQLTYENRLKIAVDISFGMVRLHQNHYTHKCLYSNNILIDSELTAKINLFRFSSFICENNPKRYNFPSVFLNMPLEFFDRNFKPNSKTDIFSFGLIILDLFGGHHEIKCGNFKIIKDARIFNSLILKCLNNETERPTSEEIYTYLKLFYSYVKYKINSLKYLSTKRTRNRNEIDINTYIIDLIKGFTKTEREYNNIQDFIDLLRVEITEIIHRCFFCTSPKFKYYKYQCLVCKDFYLCNECFEQRRKNDHHKLCHPLIRYEESYIDQSKKNLDSNLNIESYRILFQNKIHKNSMCINCKMKPIQGIILKCDICYNFSLCYTCFSKCSNIEYESSISNSFPFKKEFKMHHYESHPMIIDYQNELKLEHRDVFITSRIIGRGGFGIVYEGRISRTEMRVACKKITDKNSERSLISFEKELDGYKEIKGENILRMIGYFIHENSIHLLTELMERGSLENVLERDRSLKYETRLKIAIDIASGTARIHEKGFIHKDIRPANIFISIDYTAKIGDFGTARLKEEKNNNFGHRGYMPNEFFPPIEQYNQKLDVFTMGLTFLELFNGKHTKVERTKVTQKPFVFKGLINDCIAQVRYFNRPKSKNVYDYLYRCYDLLQKKIEKNLAYHRTLSLNEEKIFFKETHDQEFIYIRL